MTQSRRAFLAWLGSGALAGCSVGPDASLWEFWNKAEGVWQALLEGGSRVHSLVKTYPKSAISLDFPVRSLALPDGYADQLSHWELVVDGLVERPRRYTLPALRDGFPKVAEVTRHDCVEGWSAIAEWGGVRLSDLLAAAGVRPEARYVVCQSADYDEQDGSPYYGSLTVGQAAHPQTLLAYEKNGQPLPVEYGAPLRLKVPSQLGYKSTKFVHRVALVATLEGFGKGRGGYWEDTGYEHYAGI